MLYNVDRLKMSKNNFRKLFKLSTSGLQFSFNSQNYSQHDGIAIGSLLGPTLANMFIGFIETMVIPSFKYKLHYSRYVDNCFVLVKNEEDIDEFFTILNQAHNVIQFTVEKEIDNELAFLNILVKRHKNRFLTCVFRKKTFTGNYLNFQLKFN